MNNNNDAQSESETRIGNWKHASFILRFTLGVILYINMHTYSMTSSPPIFCLLTFQKQVFDAIIDSLPAYVQLIIGINLKLLLLNILFASGMTISFPALLINI